MILKQSGIESLDLMIAAMSNLSDDEVFNDVDLFVKAVHYIVANSKQIATS
jgi:hypothetical protein